MQFAAIDVETANSSTDSICAIGIARFHDAQIFDEWYSLVNPKDFFDPFNTMIHGIFEEDVEDAPTFPDALMSFKHLLENNTVVSHTSFDRVRMQRTAQSHSVELPECQWIDSAAVARHVWPEISRKGWGLANVCKKIGYEFRHHHALEDAKASGQVVLAAVEHAGISLEEILAQKAQARTRKQKAIAMSGNPDGKLFGEVVAFTGTLSASRRDAAILAATAGCRVASGVSRETTILVVGDTDIRKLVGHNTSSKHRKARSLIEDGFPIQIINETDFRALVSGE